MLKSDPIEDPLFSAKLRLARAHQHLDNLEAQIDKFFAEKPYTQLTELDPDGVHAIHKIQVTKSFPTEWCLLTTEIVEHLRASLDHAVFATRIKDPTNCALFPFGETAADLDNSVKGRSKDTPKEIQSLLRSFDACDTGNGILYALNKLCNASKHGLIMLVAGIAHSGEITGTAESIGGGVQFLEPLVWDGAKNEIKYARTKRGVYFDHKGKIRVYVALMDSEGVSPHPAPAILDALLRECDRVVRAIEAQAARIGAFK